MTVLILYHYTSWENACSIRERGFLDGVDAHMTRHEAVWLTDDSDDPFQGAGGTCRIAVHILATEAVLDQFERRDEESDYREWLIPAEVLNNLVGGLDITDEVDELEWGYHKGPRDTEIEPNGK